MPRLTIPERFLLTRRRMGLTQQQLAKILRVSRKTVNTVENGGVIRRETIDRFTVLEKRQRAIRREKTRSRTVGANHKDRSLAGQEALAHESRVGQ